MIDKIEWWVAYRDEEGMLHRAQDGAQTTFSKSSGEKLAKKLGAPWDLIHQDSKLPPEQHSQWKARQGGQPAETVPWGGWSK